MPEMDRGKSGLLAMVALALLASLLFANLMYVNEATEHQISSFEPEAQEERDRVVAMSKIPAAPGDRVSVDWYPLGTLRTSVFEAVEVFAIEEGEGQMVVQGATAPHTYAHRTAGAGPEADLPVEPLVLVRPPVNERPVEAEFDFPGPWLDLVWVFHIAPGESLPEDEIARELFLGGLDIPEATDVAITRASAVQAQPWFYAGQATLGLAALVLGALTLRPSRSQPQLDEDATDTEALIGLVDRGECYLANLRNLLVITGLLLVFLGLFGVVAIDDVFLLAVDPGAPGDTWETWMDRGFAFVYATLVATWLGLLVVVQRALARWRKHAEARPLDL